MISPSSPDLHRPLVSLGAGLLATAVVLSTFYSRDRPHLDWSNYVVGLAATFGLLAIAALAAGGSTRVRAGRTSDAAAWPGAVGAVAAGLMVGVGLDDRAVTSYVAGAVVLAVSAVGWLATWRDPYVVTAVLGLFVLLGAAFDDVVGVDGGDRLWPPALALVVFAVAVTAAGWRLPARTVSGVTAGAIAALGLASLTGLLAITGLFEAAFSAFSTDFGDASAPALGVSVGIDDPFGHVRADTWITLALALVLVAFWTLCAALTGAIGFRILVVATAVSVTPLATVALRVDHPTWWGVALGAAGGIVLLAALRQASPAGDATETSGT